MGKLFKKTRKKYRGGATFDKEAHEKLLKKWYKYYLGPENKTIIMRIGTMGSGKTSAVNTFIEDVLQFNPNMFSIIDLDHIVTTSGYMTDPTKWWDAQVTIGGYQITDKIIQGSINKGINFSTESTGKFICPSRKIISIASRSGFSSIGVCPYVPYFELKGRIKARADEEGRNVSISELEDNIKNMLPRLLDIAPLCDSFHILSNFVPKGSRPIELVRLNTDFSKYDSEKCCKWSFNDEEIKKLINILYENQNKYTSSNELIIYKLENKFLNSILSTSPHGYEVNTGI